MALMWKDTTGTATDCEKPLSRKKLKQLMPQSRLGLTSAELNAKIGRKPGLRLWKKAAKKREDRARLRKFFTKRTLEDGTTVQAIPTPAEVEMMKPTIFERLGSMFGNLRKKAEREKAKGK